MPAAVAEGCDLLILIYPLSRFEWPPKRSQAAPSPTGTSYKRVRKVALRTTRNLWPIPVQR